MPVAGLAAYTLGAAFRKRMLEKRRLAADDRRVAAASVTEERFVAYTIVDTCIGCTACTKRCPTNAITGTRNVVHVIDPTLCIDCVCVGANPRLLAVRRSHYC